MSLKYGPILNKKKIKKVNNTGAVVKNKIKIKYLYKKKKIYFYFFKSYAANIEVKLTAKDVIKITSFL